MLNAIAVTFEFIVWFTDMPIDIYTVGPWREAEDDCRVGKCLNEHATTQKLASN